MHRTTAVRALALALTTIAAGSTAPAGTLPVNRWLSPANGDWTNAANWSLPFYPGQNMLNHPLQDVVIDAVGDPYTILLNATISRGIETLTLNSANATLAFDRGRLAPLMIDDPGFTRFDIHAGTLLFDNGSFPILAFAGGEQNNRVGELGVIRVGESRRSTASFFGALDNYGLIAVGEDSSIAFDSFRGSTGIVNHTSGRIELADDASFGFRAFFNHGVIHAMGDTRVGSMLGDSTPYFENYGLVEVDGSMILDASGFHAGEIRATDDSIVDFRGTHFFSSAASLTGPGEFHFTGASPLAGAIGGNARLHVSNAQTIAAHITDDVSLIFQESDHIDFLTRFDGGGLILGQSVGSATFTAPVSANEFVSEKGDLIFHQALIVNNRIVISSASALFEESVSTGSLHLTAVYDGNRPEAEVRFASQVSVNGDAVLGGIANQGAIFDHRLTVGGNLTATGSAFNDFISVGGNATFNAPATSITHGLEVGGLLTFNGGTLDGPVAAQSVLFDRSLRVNLYSTSITADTVTVRGTELRLNRASTISGDLDLRWALNTYAPRIETTARYFANQDLLYAHGIVLGGDATLSGDLELLLAASSDPVPLGASFTLIDAGGTITGEFERLFLPTLSDGLFFEVVYEPSAVRLVVVPAPGALHAALGIGAFLSARRRRC